MKTSGKITQQQSNMFDYTDRAISYCGNILPPDPAGISEINEAFKNSVYSVLYGQTTAEDAAWTFREQADEILTRNN